MGYEQIIILIIVVVAAVIPIKMIANKKKKKQSITYYPKKNDQKRDIDTMKREQNEKSLDLLKERLVSGKINKEEYDNLKKEFES